MPSEDPPHITQTSPALRRAPLYFKQFMTGRIPCHAAIAEDEDDRAEDGEGIRAGICAAGGR